MVKRKHKIISLILCLVLVVSAVCAGTVSAFAASGDTVYVRANNGWSNLHCYMWSDGKGDNKAWPGVQMTKVSDDVYSYTLTDDYANVIFNNGSGAQTGDLTYPGNGKIYDLSKGAWEDYDGPTNPTTATTATTATSATQQTTVAPQPPVGSYTVYLENEAGWSSPKCYMWNSSTDANKAWPGESMTNVGGNVWQYTASKEYKNCIFNSGSNQTGDLTASYGQIYNNKTNTWSVYDVSDLQVKSFTADPAKGIYVGTEVNLSAEAVNTKTGAAVSYKFSVTNAQGGTSVISDFSSTNSVVWQPTAAGTYTVTFDFKDTAGNENTRSMDLTVEDDSTLTKPVIKGVSPANLNLIKVNNPTTVSVKAGGGKTGTNLLFYKYVVTDPNGVKNTPYYTLNNTYSFTPSMAGTYTVNVYVQASDNSTVNKTYTYNATNGDIPTTTAPVPTTVPVPTTTAPVPTTTAPVPTTTAPVPTTKPTDPVRLFGDANNDGVVSVLDATYIQKSIVELPGVTPYYELDLEICDINGDGYISVKDVTALQLMIVNS